MAAHRTLAAHRIGDRAAAVRAAYREHGAPPRGQRYGTEGTWTGGRTVVEVLLLDADTRVVVQRLGVLDVDEGTYTPDRTPPEPERTVEEWARWVEEGR